MSEIYKPPRITAEVRRCRYKRLSAGISGAESQRPRRWTTIGLFETQQEGEGEELPTILKAFPIHWVAHVCFVLNLAKIEQRQK